MNVIKLNSEQFFTSYLKFVVSVFWPEQKNLCKNACLFFQSVSAGLKKYSSSPSNYDCHMFSCNGETFTDFGKNEMTIFALI